MAAKNTLAVAVEAGIRRRNEYKGKSTECCGAAKYYSNNILLERCSGKVSLCN